MENTLAGLNHEYFELGYYIYPFLSGGKEYTFDFIFKNSKRKVLKKESITVVPVKGKEIFIPPVNDSIVINPDTLDCSIVTKPEINLPKDSFFVVNVWDNNWNYLGDMHKNLSDFDCFSLFNVYTDITYKVSKEKLESIQKVIIQFGFSYKYYGWDYYISGVLPFSPKKLLNH